MKKKIIFSVLAMIMIFSLSKSIFADNLYIGGKLSRGVGNMYYYVDSTASGYTSLINNAVDNWVDTGYGWNPIYMAPVASNYATDMDFYAVYSLDYGVIAQTSMYDINEVQVTPSTTNWFFAKIELATSVINNYGNNDKQGTIAHEMGHGFGLNHQNNNTSSIMCQKGAGRIVYLVDYTSHNCINYLYN